MHQVFLCLLVQCFWGSKNVHALYKFEWASIAMDKDPPFSIRMSGAAAHGGSVWTFGGQLDGPAVSSFSQALSPSVSLKAKGSNPVNHDTEKVQPAARSANSHVPEEVEQSGIENWNRAVSVRALTNSSSSGGPWSTQKGSQQMFKIGPSLVEKIVYQNGGNPMTVPKSRLLPLMCADSDGILWMIGGVSGNVG
jgi:hypothetical protein